MPRSSSSGLGIANRRVRVREAFVSLTRLGGCGSRSFGRFGQELFDVLVPVVALTDFHQAGKMEFHPSFVLTTFQWPRTLAQVLLFGAELLSSSKIRSPVFRGPANVIGAEIKLLDF